MAATIGTVKVDLIAQVQGSKQQHKVATIDMPLFASYPSDGDAGSTSASSLMRRNELAAGFHAIADAIEAE